MQPIKPRMAVNPSAHKIIVERNRFGDGKELTKATESLALPDGSASGIFDSTYNFLILIRWSGIVVAQPAVVKAQMKRRALIIVIIGLASSLRGQAPAGEWQSALILEVKEHQSPVPDKKTDSSSKSYDVSIRVKDKEYGLLYTPRPGAHGFQYLAGMNTLVLVKEKTITFNDILGRPVTLPIVSQKPVSPKPQAPKH